MTFIITQFHIIFVYPKNFTVLSSITQEIVYSRNFDDILIINSLYDLFGKNVLIMGQGSQIEYSALANEERNAWKQYLKKGLTKQALENCHSS